jgi:opacity protein-like surface antigen
MPGRLRVRLLVMLCVVAAGWLASPPTAHGQGNIEVVPFRIIPSIDLGLEYNDNILLSPSDELKDFIWTISPGVSVELPARRFAVRLGYRADILRYLDNDRLDTIHHTGQLDARVNFPGGLGLYLNDEFRRTNEFAGFPIPELVNALVTRHENLFSAGVEYQVRERISLAVDYKFLLVDYVDKAIFEELDRQDHQVGLTVFVRVLPKTSVLGEVDYQIIRYRLDEVSRDRDSDSLKGKVGVKGDLTAKTSVLLKVGEEWKDYINPAREDWTGLIAEAELIWKYREPSQVRIYGGRANVESLFALNSFFVTSYGGVELRHQVNPKLLVRMVGLAGVNDYQVVSTVDNLTQKRSDTFYQVGAGIRYQIQRWLALELDYEHLVRDSNFPSFDYTANRITAFQADLLIGWERSR